MNLITNPPILYLSIFLASLVYVAVRSGQQINVQNKIYMLIPLFSIVMGFLDVFIMSMIVKHATGELWMIASVMGLGGGIGSCLAVYLHHKYLTKKKDDYDNY